MIPLITHSQVHAWFSAVLSSGLSPFLVGGVGRGNSQLTEAYAKKRQLKLHEIYLDSMYEMDVIGYAVPNQDTKKFEYLPCNLFPLEGDPLEINPDTGKPYKGHLIVFEEFGNCPKSMQVAAQRVILRKSIGSHKLHDKAEIILLGNKVSSGANAIPISAAIRSRCGIAELQTDSQESVNNFLQFMKEDNWHPSVVQWASINQGAIRKDDDKLIKDGESPFLTWRGLEALSKLVNRMHQSSVENQKPLASIASAHLATFQSLIGYDHGSDFYSSLLNPSTGLEEILLDPTNAQIPSSTAEILKVASYLSSNVTTEDQVDTMLLYLQRLPAEVRMSVANKITSNSTYLNSNAKVKKLFEFPF